MQSKLKMQQIYSVLIMSNSYHANDQWNKKKTTTTTEGKLVKTISFVSSFVTHVFFLTTFLSSFIT